MSYYRIFHPTKEQVEQIEMRAHRSSFYGFRSTDIELTTYCMLDHSQDKISDVISHISMLLTSIKYDCEGTSYRYAVKRYKEDDKETIWFCGREHDERNYDDEFDRTMKYSVEKLTELAYVVKTPDWFDNSEKFYEKKSEIQSTIEYFSDSAALLADFEIMDFLKDCEDPEDDYLYWRNKSADDLKKECGYDSNIEEDNEEEEKKEEHLENIQKPNTCNEESCFNCGSNTYCPTSETGEQNDRS